VARLSQAATPAARSERDCSGGVASGARAHSDTTAAASERHHAHGRSGALGLARPRIASAERSQVLHRVCVDVARLLARGARAGDTSAALPARHARRARASERDRLGDVQRAVARPADRRSRRARCDAAATRRSGTRAPARRVGERVQGATATQAAVASARRALCRQRAARARGGGGWQGARAAAAPNSHSRAARGHSRRGMGLAARSRVAGAAPLCGNPHGRGRPRARTLPRAPPARARLDAAVCRGGRGVGAASAPGQRDGLAVAAADRDRAGGRRAPLRRGRAAQRVLSCRAWSRRSWRAGAPPAGARAVRVDGVWRGLDGHLPRGSR
jgi:hypothetical protein